MSEAKEIAERLSAMRLTDVSTKDHMHIIETVFRVGDLTMGQHLVYLTARQNQRIIELLESIEIDTTRIAAVQEQA
jgi:hypothetical protein